MSVSVFLLMTTAHSRVSAVHGHGSKAEAEEEEDGDLMVKYWATRKHSGVTSSMHTSTSRFDGKKDVKVLTVLATGCTVSVTVSYVIQYSIMLCFTYTYI